MHSSLLSLQRLVTATDLHFTDDQVATMLAHVGDPDPTIRDDTVYTLFARGFTENRLTAEQKRLVAHKLLHDRPLFTAIDQPQGSTVFLRTFTALLTALLLESDARETWLPTAIRDQFIADALAYLPREHDTRGWVTGNGWADGICHGSDLLGAAWSHPHFNQAQAPQALAAIATVLTHQPRPFVNDEEPRLAMPIVQVLTQHHLRPEDLVHWLQETDTTIWRDFSFTDHAAIARTHNWLTFCHHLFFLLPADEPIHAVLQAISHHYYHQNGYLN